MTSTDNVSFRLIRRKLLKLSKAQLTKQCKEFNVSPIGSKNEMTFKILKKLGKNKKKKKSILVRKKRKKESKNTNIKRVKQSLKLPQQQLSFNSHSSHSTNLYQNFVNEDKYNKNIIYSSVTSRGYKQIEKISTTLQGNVFVACKTSLHIDCVLIYGCFREIIYEKTKYKMNENHKAIIQICYAYYKQDIVIKTANKRFYTNESIKSQSENMENIIKESHFQSIFMNNNAPKSMIKHIDFFQDDNNYYLVMEKGGNEDLFEFNCKSHKLINSGKLALCEWRKTVKNIFYKMVKFIYWLHHDMNSCYLDLSLENIIINNEVYFDENIGSFNCNNVDIKFVDFGLTEMFDITDIFSCNKYVGKASYCAPKIYDKKPFLANKADIYSLGVCLWLLTIGAPPYSQPNCSDPYFKAIKQGKMLALLKSWNRLHYIEYDEAQLQLLLGMLCIDEKKRFSIDQILNHVWLKECVTPSCIVESNTIDTDDDLLEVD